MKQTSSARGKEALLLTAALFSTGGVAIKSVHLPGVAVASLRSGIAAAALLLLLPAARRNWNWRMLPVAVAYALTLVTFVLATKLTTGANAIFLQDTAPLYILIFGALFLGERAHARDIAFLLPIAAGMALFFAGQERARDTAPNPMLGNWIAASSGFFYALVVVGFRWLSRSTKGNASLASVALGNTLAFTACLPFAWPLPPASPADWAVLGYLGVVQIGVGYWLMTRAMAHVQAFEASLLLLLEPVLNPIWTWIAFREQPGKLALAGGALIIGATAFRTWRQGRREVLR